MNTPLVSIVIPIYKVEKYLRQCVDSVLAQTYTNLEIILVDDGSPDNCYEICNDYASRDERITIIHKKNEGLSAARNDGINISHGRYIFFQDSDDYLAPTAISSLVQASQNGALAVLGYQLDWEDIQVISLPEQTYANYKSVKQYCLDFHNNFATKFNFAWGKLYDSSIIKKYRLTFPTGISLVEDVIFNLNYYRLCKNGINLIEDNGYFYRQRGNKTLSKKFDPRMFDWNSTCYEAIRTFLKEFDAWTEENQNHLYRNIAGNYQYGFCLVANNPYIKFNKKLRIISEYALTPIYQNSLSVAPQKRFDYCLLQYLLKHNLYRTYITLENIKTKLVHRLH